MIKSKDTEQYSNKEASRRFEAALRGAFNTPPKPMKEISRTRPKAKRKPRKKATASA
jgi:hypothetical protein